MLYKKITCCRICGNTNLQSVFHLGDMSLTGVFPKKADEIVPTGPLELVKCIGSLDRDAGVCGLTQLGHNYDLDTLYGGYYGYRSGLSPLITAHLLKIVQKAIKISVPCDGDSILDIGSNDGTLLSCYPKGKFNLVGIDPTIKKFQKYYPSNIYTIEDFFSLKRIRKEFSKEKFKIITGIAVFYDLKDPLSFLKGIANLLDNRGICILEQSYLSLMLKNTAYDTICHEHFEYYGIKQIQWLAKEADLKIIDLRINDINGGSLQLVLALNKAPFKEAKLALNRLLKEENAQGLETLKPFRQFSDRVFRHIDQLLKVFSRLKLEGKKIFGYGASTKGNVLLQFCRLTSREIPFIAEINDNKWGCFTPGTKIPIISEEKAKDGNPDIFFVLPWHLKKNILNKEREYLKKGGKMLFPLPYIQ